MNYYLLSLLWQFAVFGLILVTAVMAYWISEYPINVVNPSRDITSSELVVKSDRRHSISGRLAALRDNDPTSNLIYTLIRPSGADCKRRLK